MHGINVNAVAPGITATPMAVRALGDLDALVSAGPMANLLHACRRPRTSPP